jgi:hypothetical protein
MTAEFHTADGWRVIAVEDTIAVDNMAACEAARREGDTFPDPVTAVVPAGIAYVMGQMAERNNPLGPCGYCGAFDHDAEDCEQARADEAEQA